MVATREALLPLDGNYEDLGSRWIRRTSLIVLVAIGVVAIVGVGGHTLPHTLGRGTTGLVGSPNISFKHFPQISSMSIPKMPGAQGSNSFILDIGFSNVPGKEMAAGLYRLDAGPKLNYTYTYEEFKLIIDGEFHLIDGTGQKIIAKKGDLIYFPRGTNVLFDAPVSALGYFIGQRISPDSDVKINAAVRAAIASNPAMKHYPQIAADSKVAGIPLLKNVDGSKSYLGDIGFSKVAHEEMTVGFYHELAGPTLHYTYTYEEMKYILDGEFHVTDGTGQKVVAKKGDLMYFPKGVEVAFETPDFALGFYCGQRKGGTA